LASNCFSHSNHSLLQLSFQLVHLSLQLCPQSTTSNTSLSLHCETVNNLGNSSFNTLQTTHLSSQNLAFLPSLRLHNIRPSNQFPCCSLPYTLHKSFHHCDCLLWTILTLRFLQSPYLADNTSLHNPSPIFLNLHFHFANKASLKHLISLIPNPPTWTGLHTFFHFTHAIFLPSLPQPHKKFDWILLIVLQTTISVLKKEK